MTNIFVVVENFNFEKIISRLHCTKIKTNCPASRVKLTVS